MTLEEITARIRTLVRAELVNLRSLPEWPEVTEYRIALQRWLERNP